LGAAAPADTICVGAESDIELEFGALAKPGAEGGLYRGASPPFVYSVVASSEDSNSVSASRDGIAFAIITGSRRVAMDPNVSREGLTPSLCPCGIAPRANSGDEGGGRGIR
jgi:hypothetical protein